MVWGGLELESRELSLGETPLGSNHAERALYNLLECSTAYLHACLEHVPHHAHRGFQTFHEGIFCLGEIDRTVFTFVYDPVTMILCAIGRMILNVSRVASRAFKS